MSAPSIKEQQIVEALHRVAPERWSQVLAFIGTLQAEEATGPDIAALAATVWTAPELQRWPRPVQDAIVREQAARLIEEYRQDPDPQREATWWQAQEIGQLPRDQRDIILEASAIVAEADYHSDPEL